LSAPDAILVLCFYHCGVIFSVLTRNDGLTSAQAHKLSGAETVEEEDQQSPTTAPRICDVLARSSRSPFGPRRLLRDNASRRLPETCSDCIEDISLLDYAHSSKYHAHFTGATSRKPTRRHSALTAWLGACSSQGTQMDILVEGTAPTLMNL
jgi:hypothetical protein